MQSSFLMGWVINPEDLCSKFLRKAGNCLPAEMAKHLRKFQSLSIPKKEPHTSKNFFLYVIFRWTRRWLDT